MTTIPLNNFQHKYWLDDPAILYEEYIQFVPTLEMTRASQVNALTRFFIYLFILFLLFRKSNWLVIPIVGIFIVNLLYLIIVNDSDGKQKELDRILSLRQKDLNRQNYIESVELHHDDDPNIKLEGIDTIPKNLQVGTYNSNGELDVGGYNSVYDNLHKNDTSHLFTVDEVMEFKKNSARKPTLENPFMNPNITDYNNGDIPVAANSFDKEIKEQINVNFNHELYRDVDELWERKNSQRQFYTVPNTMIPNNQTEFARWLYLVPGTCKEDTTNCLRYVDLKYQR